MSKRIKKRERCKAFSICKDVAFVKGFCPKHYNQQRALGRILSPKEEKEKKKIHMQKVRSGLASYWDKERANPTREYAKRGVPTKASLPCTAPGCASLANAAKGLCNRHYGHVRRNGRLLSEEYLESRHSKIKCRAPECSRLSESSVFGKGLCSMHYSHLRKLGRFLSPEETKMGKYPSGLLCKAPGCDRPPDSKYLCSRHYIQMLRKGRFTPETQKKDYVRMGDKELQKAYCLIRNDQLSFSQVARKMKRSVPCISYWFGEKGKFHERQQAIAANGKIAVSSPNGEAVSRE